MVEQEVAKKRHDGVLAKTIQVVGRLESGRCSLQQLMVSCRSAKCGVKRLELISLFYLCYLGDQWYFFLF
jgi:hypothetical protein